MEQYMGEIILGAIALGLTYGIGYLKKRQAKAEKGKLMADEQGDEVLEALKKGVGALETAAIFIPSMRPLLDKAKLNMQNVERIWLDEGASTEEMKRYAADLQNLLDEAKVVAEQG